MESEKVKEIKKALECCIKNETECTCEYCKDCPAFYEEWVYEEGIEQCDIDLWQKSLTLINELESEKNSVLSRNNELLKENERLNECYKVKAYDKLRAENKQLKDRIAELENENGELLKENEGYHGSYRCAIDKIGELSAERYIKVEQFAKMLKEKYINNSNYCAKIYEPFGGITPKDIDETLKEFIDD